MFIMNWPNGGEGGPGFGRFGKLEKKLTSHQNAFKDVFIRVCRMGEGVVRSFWKHSANS